MNNYDWGLGLFGTNLPYHHPYFSGIKEESARYTEDPRRLLPGPSIVNHTLFQAAFSNTGNSSDNQVTYGSNSGNSSDSTPSTSPSNSTPQPTTSKTAESSRRRNYSNESPEARSRRLAKNAQRMREKRASETFDEYKLRLAKNAEANRIKRQNENESPEKRELRRQKNRDRNRIKRASGGTTAQSKPSNYHVQQKIKRQNETPEETTTRRQKNAERNRRRRANINDIRVILEKSKNRLRQRIKREIARMMRTREKREDFLKETFQEIANVFSEKDYHSLYQQVVDAMYMIGVT